FRRVPSRSRTDGTRSARLPHTACIPNGGQLGTRFGIRVLHFHGCLPICEGTTRLWPDARGSHNGTTSVYCILDRSRGCLSRKTRWEHLEEPIPSDPMIVQLQLAFKLFTAQEIKAIDAISRVRR